MPKDKEKREQREKREHRDNDERVLRQLDAIRRRDEQHVTGIHPDEQRQRHGGSRDEDERDQRANRHRVVRATSAARSASARAPATP